MTTPGEANAIDAIMHVTAEGAALDDAELMEEILAAASTALQDTYECLSGAFRAGILAKILCQRMGEAAFEKWAGESFGQGERGLIEMMVDQGPKLKGGFHILIVPEEDHVG